MFNTNGIEIPRLNLFEAYKIAGPGEWLGQDIASFIFLCCAVIMVSFMVLGYMGILYDIGTRLEARGETKRTRLLRIFKWVIGGGLIISIIPFILIFFFNLTSVQAKQTMLLDHYNAQAPEGYSMVMPKQGAHSVLENLLVTQEDGTVVSYETLYAIMDEDGLVSLNVNEGTKETLALVPLDQARQ